jgi:hypothetical protein
LNPPRCLATTGRDDSRHHKVPGAVS